MSNRRAVVGVMGAGEGASAEPVALAEELGECISARGWVLLTGGRPAGVMAAASRGAARVEGHLVVGVLPDEGKGDDRQDTAELDLALFTGMGKASNVINVLSADVVVICGGGGGPSTASEAAHALNVGRPLILLAVPPLWREFLCALLEIPEDLVQRGMKRRRAKQVIMAYPGLTMSHEWLKELFRLVCSIAWLYYAVLHDRVLHEVFRAPRGLWQQAAHIDPVSSNASVSEYSRREARLKSLRRYQQLQKSIYQAAFGVFGSTSVAGVLSG